MRSETGRHTYLTTTRCRTSLAASQRLLLPTFASVAELRSQPEWLGYVTLVYGLSSLTFPLDTRQFSLFYVNHLPQALRTTLVSPCPCFPTAGRMA